MNLKNQNLDNFASGRNPNFDSSSSPGLGGYTRGHSLVSKGPKARDIEGLNSSDSYNDRNLEGQDPYPGGPSAKNKIDFQKRYYTSYSKLEEVKIISIGMASPLRILQWAEKTLPNGRIYGEVLNANTLHHKTFKPQKGGLFCERIFGPLKDFECACGKIDKSAKASGVGAVPQGAITKMTVTEDKGNEGLSNKRVNPLLKTRKFCPDCDVEYTWSVIRRYQLGYIKLNSPVIHVWYLKGTPSYLSILLDMKKRYLQNVAYCSETLTLENSLSQDLSQRSLSFSSPSKIFSSWQTIIKKVQTNKPMKDTAINGQGGISKPKLASNAISLTSGNGKTESSMKENLNILRGKKRKEKAPIPTSYTSRTSYTGTTLNNLWEEKKTFGSKKIFPILGKTISLEWAFGRFQLNGPEGGMVEGGEKTTSLAQNNDMLKFLNALQYSIYYNSLSSNKSESFQIYTPKITLAEGPPFGGAGDATQYRSSTFFGTVLQRGSLKGLFGQEPVELGSDIVLDSKNSCLKGAFHAYTTMIGNDNPSLTSSSLGSPLKTPNGDSSEGKMSLMIWNKIINKLPMDLYILCSIERMIYKRILFFSISLKWQKLYEQAYLTAMYKATKILKKYEMGGIREILKTSLSVSNLVNSGLSGNALSGHQRTQSLLFTDVANQSYTKGAYKASAHYLNQMVQTTKMYFKKIVLMKLKQMNQPIYSYHLTTNLNFNSSSVVYELSKHMQKYWTESLMSSESGTGSSQKNDSFLDQLSESFLRPLLIILYLEQMKRKSVTVDEDNRATLNLEDSGTSGQNPMESTKRLYQNFVFYQQQRKSLSNSFGISVLDDLLEVGGFDFKALKKLKGQAPEMENEGVNLNKMDNMFMKQIPYEKTGMNSSLKLGYNRETNPYSKTKGHQPTLSNTIYTLSHRERWTGEKDWLYFLLYNNVSAEYTDLPIYAYKSRLFSFTEKTSFDFLNLNKSSLNRDSTYGYGKENHREKLGLKVSESLLSNAYFSGPGIIQQLLNEYSFSEIKKLDKQNRLLLYQLNQSIFKLKKQVEIFYYDKSYQKELKELCKKRDLLIRRTKFVRKFFRKDSDPSHMILTVLPVLPPDLRPIVKMGNQIAASDLNRLYQRVIYRNERLKKFLKDPATSHSYEMKYAQRLLQEAVDNLIQNGKSASSEKDNRGRPLKSLSDILKGKQGRFRQFLLGKRVDYSGRSVIVVGPKLKLHECGLPLEMAKELYLPFLLKIILNKNYAKTVIGAKSLIKKNNALAQELLREIMLVSPVLLNRAPTLHRLGFQAFVPKLVTGRAILLHPLVCSAFNADFDGDQMAVHVPITVEARAEAWKLMLSRNNILSPATGDPLAIPSQDMVLGCYYLTTLPNKIQFPRSLDASTSAQNFKETAQASSLTSSLSISLPTTVFDSNKDIKEANDSDYNTNITLLYFNSLADVMNAYNQQKILVHSLVWVKWTGFIENGSDQEEPIEIRISSGGQWQEITANYHRFYDSNNQLINQYMVTTPGRILFNLILQNKASF